MVIELKEIGIIHTPYKTKAETPFQGFQSEAVGRVEVFEEYVEGLEGIELFSHLILVYRLHRIEREKLKVEPLFDPQNSYGVFATRHPHRPNRLGLSTVKLLGRQSNVLLVKNIDMIDGSPLLDIKPYVSRFDKRVNVNDGWFKGKI